VEFTAQKIGTFDTELVREFFQALSTHGGITLHVDKAAGAQQPPHRRGLLQGRGAGAAHGGGADERAAGAIPSTKGSL
jgi:imidazoleglycerol-phosphate dehydratase